MDNVVAHLLEMSAFLDVPPILGALNSSLGGSSGFDILKRFFSRFRS